MLDIKLHYQQLLKFKVTKLKRYTFSFLISLQPSTGPVPAKTSCKRGSVTCVWMFPTYLHFLKDKEAINLKKQRQEKSTEHVINFRNGINK